MRKLRLIDNKKIALTQDEFVLYGEICKSYDRPNFDGKDLFRGLFETDDNGIIVFLKPSGKHYTSMEVLTFLQNIMIHQYLENICNEHNEAMKELNKMKDHVMEELKALRDMRQSIQIMQTAQSSPAK